MRIYIFITFRQFTIFFLVRLYISNLHLYNNEGLVVAYGNVWIFPKKHFIAYKKITATYKTLSYTHVHTYITYIHTRAHMEERYESFLVKKIVKNKYFYEKYERDRYENCVIFWNNCSFYYYKISSSHLHINDGNDMYTVDDIAYTKSSEICILSLLSATGILGEIIFLIFFFISYLYTCTYTYIHTIVKSYLSY